MASVEGWRSRNLGIGQSGGGIAMGKPYDERRRTLNLAAHRLRSEGKTNKEIAEQIGVKIEQVPGMVLAGARIGQTISPWATARAARNTFSPIPENGSAIKALPSGDMETEA